MPTCNFAKDSNGDFGDVPPRFRVFLKTTRCSLSRRASTSWKGSSAGSGACFVVHAPLVAWQGPWQDTARACGAPWSNMASTGGGPRRDMASTVRRLGREPAECLWQD